MRRTLNAIWNRQCEFSLVDNINCDYLYIAAIGVHPQLWSIWCDIWRIQGAMADAEVVVEDMSSRLANGSIHVCR
jgi:hypothetical protein